MNIKLTFSPLVFHYHFYCHAAIQLSQFQIMEAAHVDAAVVLAEVFRKSSEPYDFASQDATRRIQLLVPTMLKHSLCPPPEEIYSLHRKLFGVFLLLGKLGVKIECKSMFEEVYETYQNT
jgi:aarF domain-containing kinase